MAAPLVLVDTVVDTEIKLDTAEWQDWLQKNTAFRYQLDTSLYPISVKREDRGYIGYRKVSGRIHRKYIGRALDIPKMKSIAYELGVLTKDTTRDTTDKIDTTRDTITDTAGDTTTDTTTDTRLRILEARIQQLEDTTQIQKICDRLAKLEMIAVSEEVIAVSMGE